MPNPDAWHPTRRAIVAGGVGLFVPAAAATELPLLRGDRKQFVQFEPQPAMRPLPLQDLQDRQAALGLPKREALLLYVWATWCPSCPVELPGLARDQARIASLGIGVATVSIDTRPAAAVTAYLHKYGATALRAFHDPGAAVLSAERPDGPCARLHRRRH